MTKVRLDYLRGWDERRFWRDGDNGAEYARLAGGLAWAHEELPGWLVILGEDRQARSDGRRHVSVLHAWSARQDSLTLPSREIMDEARDLGARFQLSFWLTPDDHPDAAGLAMYNRGLGKHDRRLRLVTPPGYERASAFAVYDRLLENRTRHGYGLPHSFHTGNWDRVRQEYEVLRPADRLRPLREFPAVAAMLYALAWLEFTGGEYDGQNGQGKHVTAKGGY